MKCVLVSVAVCALLSPIAAQEQLAVRYQSAKVVWNAPAPTDAVTKHTVKCGPEINEWEHSTEVPAPANEIALKDLLPGPGLYVCSVTASNIAGESGAAFTPPFALLQGAPATPSGVAIVAD